MHQCGHLSVVSAHAYGARGQNGPSRGDFFLATRTPKVLRGPIRGPTWGIGIRPDRGWTPRKFARGCVPKCHMGPKRPKSDMAPPAWPAQGTNPAGQERIPTPKRGLLVGSSGTFAARVAKKKSLGLAYVLVSLRLLKVPITPGQWSFFLSSNREVP